MFSILLLCFQIDKDSISVANRINFDSLYDYANTLLVKFNNEKDSARKVFINSGAEGINYLVRKFDTKHAAEMSTLEEILKRMGRPAIEGILENINYRGTDEEARSLRLSLRIISEIFKFDSTLVGDDIVSRIEKFIYDQDWRVRGGVATALGYSKSRKALPHLLVLIKDTINVVRKSAAFGIKNIA
ncbi:MAG: HEAT repeat domain-containing protein, partial [candidate division WOR-3 bacterium]